MLDFVLDDFTLLGEVSANIEPAALKERLLRVFEGHKEDLLDPSIDIVFKGLYDYQLKLTSSILTHLEVKNF